MSEGKVASSTKENTNYCTDRYITKMSRAATLKQRTTKQQKQYKHEAAAKVSECEG